VAFRLSPEQVEVVNHPTGKTIFLEGPSGAGKTTAAVRRLHMLIEKGIPADQFLVLVPQRTLAKPYFELMESVDFPSGGMVDILTIGGLAQRMVALFWPLVSRRAGFSHPEKPPSFLTLETAQYFMCRIVQPMLDQGYFESIKIDPNRLYSQIIDNLNKAAVVGFPYTDISRKLKSAWVGDASQLRVYDEAQKCADLFRHHCLEHNLLDFSLQLELFLHQIWPSLLGRSYLQNRYRHLIFDNVEEDIPVCHDLVKEWLPDFESALLVYDTGGGNRSFLGADPDSGINLSELADIHFRMDGSFCTPPNVLRFGQNLARIIRHEQSLEITVQGEQPGFCYQRFYPEMMEWVSSTISDLVNLQEVNPSEIVILAPYLSDALRFSLLNILKQHHIPARSHRPSRSLKDEPAAQCLLTLTRLAHPTWNDPPTILAFRHALMQAVSGMDLVRADLLARITYKPSRLNEGLSSFESINTEMQERITFVLGDRFENLRKWLEAYRQEEPMELDSFLGRLFGEVLSQPGFLYHEDLDSAGITGRLIESIQKFRWAAGAILAKENVPLGQEYCRMLINGTISAQSLRAWQNIESMEAVLIAPAYTFLMGNQPVRYQVWLDIGGRGWWERLFQPLTHPQVLSRHWLENATWTDAHENQLNQTTLARLVEGLTRRCKDNIFLCAIGVNEQGEEIRGHLLTAYQGLRRRMRNDQVNGNV